MPHFLCKIGTGGGRIVEKQYQSTSQQQLRQTLKDQGFHVIAVRRQLLRGLSLTTGQGGKLTGNRFISFNQELLVLLRSGLPVLQVFDTQLEQLESGFFRDVLLAVREDVRGGSSLSDAFSAFPQIFPPLYLAALKAGEKTGDLPKTMKRYLVYQKRVENIRSKVRGASFYPLILTAAAVAVVVFLMLFVVPRFTEIYTDANVELPFITQVLITLSHLFLQYWYLFPLLCILFSLAVRGMLNHPKGRLWYDRSRLRIPFLGRLWRDYALASFSRTLGTTLGSGTPLVEGMRMSRGTLNNLSLEMKLGEAIHRIEEGSSLSAALARTGFFTPLALRMVSVGETSGALTDMLEDLSDYYDNQVEGYLSRLTTMIEPVLMMSMGLLIAFIIVAMYVPIFQMGSVVG